MSMPYTSLPATAPSLSTASYAGLSYGQNDLLGQSQDLMNSSRPMYDGGYSSASTQPSNAYTSAPAPYAPLASYGQSLAQQQQAQQDNRRMSESSSSQSHNAYVDVLDAGRGLVGMSQDLTPRNIYGPRGDRGLQFNVRIGGFCQLPNSTTTKRAEFATRAAINDGPIQLQDFIKHSKEAQMQDLPKAVHATKLAANTYVQSHRRKAIRLRSSGLRTQLLSSFKPPSTS
ncbi:MAG: hypothetical protein MMC33_002831 [Icmadophila ericetorum]|nr:hypothetical protein [Icmadophila ericetorum]